MAPCHRFQPFGKLILWRHVPTHLKPCHPSTPRKGALKVTVHRTQAEQHDHITSLPDRLEREAKAIPYSCRGRHSEALRCLTVRNLAQFWLFELHYTPHDGPHYGAHSQGLCW